MLHLPMPKAQWFIAASLLTVAGAALAYTSFPFNASKSAPRRAGRYVIASRLSNHVSTNSGLFVRDADKHVSLSGYFELSPRLPVQSTK